MSSENLLVSVCVLSYNSSKYIVETLESIKRQTYRFVELVICDDFSKDDTSDICEAWLAENSDRFVSYFFLQTEHNKGIPANLNNGIYKSQGEWIKIIAADDILLDNCIEADIGYIRSNNRIDFLFSKVDFLFCDGYDENSDTSKFDYDFFTLSISEKYKYLVINGNCIPAPTSFIRKDAIIQLGYFDESIRLLEDYPMWLKALKGGYDLFFLNIATVKYRVHGSSVSIGNNLEYWKCQYLFYKKYIYLPLLKYNFLNAVDRDIVLKSRKSKGFAKVFYKFIRVFSPYFYFRIYLRWME